MKVTLLIFTLLAFTNSNDNCERLKDGNYLAKHTSKNGAADYKLTIAGETSTFK